MSLCAGLGSNRKRSRNKHQKRSNLVSKILEGRARLETGRPPPLRGPPLPPPARARPGRAARPRGSARNGCRAEARGGRSAAAAAARPGGAGGAPVAAGGIGRLRDERPVARSPALGTEGAAWPPEVAFGGGARAVDGHGRSAARASLFRRAPPEELVEIHEQEIARRRGVAVGGAAAAGSDGEAGRGGGGERHAPGAPGGGGEAGAAGAEGDWEEGQLDEAARLGLLAALGSPQCSPLPRCYWCGAALVSLQCLLAALRQLGAAVLQLEGAGVSVSPGAAVAAAARAAAAGARLELDPRLAALAARLLPEAPWGPRAGDAAAAAAETR
ncbi:unnamed protein product [Prorocentrum cordatum]|uniref:Uncharacterized protein n=1 Tax=Prorocentrum cordatum TaxID=2364126 RepID=A0ABN9QGN4_9DINO|nr:unnamed protein product [Polarella glacialis]